MAGLNLKKLAITSILALTLTPGLGVGVSAASSDTDIRVLMSGQAAVQEKPLIADGPEMIQSEASGGFFFRGRHVDKSDLPTPSADPFGPAQPRLKTPAPKWEPVLPDASPQMSKAAQLSAPKTGDVELGAASDATSTAPNEGQTTSQGDVPGADSRRIVINIPSRQLWLYQGNKIVRYFPVGVGRPGFMTPMGHFSVIRKIVDPGWEHPYLPQGKVRIAPGENNPLGTRWMGFYQKNGGEFGMHGTDTPSSVGKFSSHGCVRMQVKDAETLFDLVDIGTPVDIVYEPVLVRRSGNNVRIQVYPDVFKKGTPSADAVKAKILKEFPQAQVDPARLQAALKVKTGQPQVVATVQDFSTSSPVVEKPASAGSRKPVAAAKTPASISGNPPNLPKLEPMEASHSGQ